MNDEVRQLREEIFNRIILGVILIGLVIGLIILVTDGVSSLWFMRAMIGVVVAVIAFILRLTGRLVVASYVLVLALIGLVVEMFLQSGAMTNFTPYLFIPIAIIAGLLFTPLATLGLVIFSIVAILLSDQIRCQKGQAKGREQHT